ncbi:type II secretion system protein GspL [Microbulbifer litoralis]|uniref:type II secretion system protein GspL n=1 Tax=Microbulbifer litoralis TaxID=2933965 RepID=UPI0020296A71|nr:type II secretion system protein GspL [Microbulbifer sp. GX H0434]
MKKSSTSESTAGRPQSQLILLRLVEGDGSGPPGVECWSDRGWRPVSVDDDFARAFRPGCEPPVPPEDALALSFPEGARALLLVPGSWVWSGLQNVPKAVRRQGNAVGYMVEERLAEDVEDLHFVCQPRSGDQCSVYAVARDKMDALYGQIQRLQWPLVAAIPEFQLLDLMDGGRARSGALWLDGDRAHIWQAAGYGLSVRRQHLQPLLASLAEPGEEGEPLPQLQLFGAGERDAMTVAELESLFGDGLEQLPGAAEEALLSRCRIARLANLLSGDYQIEESSDERDWWHRPLKLAAACFVAQLLLFAAAGGYYQWRASAAEGEVRELFSELFPQVTPRADIRRQVEGYLNRASGAGSSFGGQMQLLAGVWSRNKGGDLKLQSLRFDGNRGEMVLQLQAENLTDLDRVVGELSSTRFRAELLAANELEEGVAGRIRLR